MKSNLIKRGFLSLTATQFFGAANDNIIKGVIIFMVLDDGAWKGRLGAGGQGIVSICFTLPFILLSGYAGQFADRNSKRYVSVLMKIVEVPIALVALIGFWSGSLWVSLAALTALTCQSAFFGPAKYGMIPELVDSRDLSRANGAINMMTNIAVIVGTYAAGEIADRYYPPEGAGVLWLPGVVMVLVAALGLMAVLFLPPLSPGDRNLKYSGNPFATYISVLKEMWGSPLIMVMMAWGYFYFIAQIALLTIPEYKNVLSEYNVTSAEASVLLGVLAVSIAIGSGLAGLISGHAIHPRLIPIGAAGLTLCCILLGTVPPRLPYPDLAERLRILPSWISVLIFGAGVSAGFYIIPLQALLQKLSPADERGRFLGVANGVSFTFLTLASGLYWLIRPAFGTGAQQHPEKIFLLSGILMIAGSVFFLWRLKVRKFSFDRME